MATRTRRTGKGKSAPICNTPPRRGFDPDEDGDGSGSVGYVSDDGTPELVSDTGDSDSDEDSEAARRSQARLKAKGKVGLVGKGGSAMANKKRKPPEETGAKSIANPAGTSTQLPAVFSEFSSRRSVPGLDNLSPMALKAWQEMAKRGSIPPMYIRYYKNEVIGDHKLNALNLGKVQILPQGFPEFCHFISKGISSKSAALLPPGLRSFAGIMVDEVKKSEGPPAGVGGKVAPGTFEAVASVRAAKAAAVAAVVRKKEKRESRKAASKRAGSGNGGFKMAENIQNALANLEEDIREDMGSGGGGYS
ncbi:unnamed protein product, partial [Discosporangium mesarthrocarpum]